MAVLCNQMSQNIGEILMISIDNVPHFGKDCSDWQQAMAIQCQMLENQEQRNEKPN